MRGRGDQPAARTPELDEQIARMQTVVTDTQATVHPDLVATGSALAGRERLAADPDATALPRMVLAYDDADAADLRVIDLIAQGGMGRIDLAMQRSFGREVAIKRVRAERLSGRTVSALIREAEVTGRLDHPNIVPVHLVGRTPEGHPLFVMKRIEGVSWSALIHDDAHEAWGGPAPDRLARHLEILQHVCNAVEFAHRRGVVHRDLKPSNVMVGELGEVYVLDWGIAVRLDGELDERLAGTPAYMAPEMLSGSVCVDPRTDVYLLGAMLHEVLTRRPRHEGGDVPTVVCSVALSEPIDYPASVPSELAAICNRATARLPEDRYESALAFRDALAAHVQHRGSMELVAEGENKLVALHERMRAGADDTAKQDDARRLATEADFAFRQALRTWPDNPDARARREECLEAMFELELIAGDAAGASALLQEMTGPRPDLEARWKALADELAQRAQAREALEELGREHDFAVSTPARVGALILVHAGILAASLALAAVGLELTNPMLLALIASGTGGYALLAYAKRRTLFATKANRTLQASLAIWFATGLAITAASWLVDASVDGTMAVLGALSTFAAFQIAVWTNGTTWIYAVLWVPVALLAWLWPGHGFLVIAVMSVATMLGGAIRLGLRRRARSRAKSAGSMS